MFLDRKRRFAGRLAAPTKWVGSITSNSIVRSGFVVESANAMVGILGGL
jgi:hypothetical protein